MELTPQLLETQQFPEKWRGYDQDAVDEFLERVGVAVAELQDRLRSSAERVAELETRKPGRETVASATSSSVVATPAKVTTATASTAATATDADESQIGRVLILAQAAADAAIAEANADAALIIKTANENSDTVAGEARTKATTIEATAIQNADRLTAEADRRHAEATNKLDDADAHVARLAQETVSSARAEAAGLIARAKGEADAMRSQAASSAAADAAQAIVAVRAELTELETTRSVKQAEVSALSNELTTRQDALASVVGDLETLLGRVGSLGSAVTPATSAEQPPMAAPVSEDPEPASPVDTPKPEPTQSSSAVIAQPPKPSQPAVPTVDTPSQPAPDATATVAKSAEIATSDSGPSALATLVEGKESGATVATATPDTHVATPVTADSAEAEPSSEVIDLTDSAVAEQDELKDLWAGIAAPASVGGGNAVVDDPFLAALRGPDRVEFDGSGEPDDDRSGFRRRRRTRRL